MTDRIRQINNNDPYHDHMWNDYELQNIENAWGSVVNCDNYAVRITTLPSVNGQQLTKEALLDYFRRNINSFFSNPSIPVFTPYNSGGINDTNL